MINGRDQESYNLKESEKHQKDEPKKDAAEDTADDELEKEPQVLLVTHLDNILHPIF